MKVLLSIRLPFHVAYAAPTIEARQRAQLGILVGASCGEAAASEEVVPRAEQAVKPGPTSMVSSSENGKLPLFRLNNARVAGKVVRDQVLAHQRPVGLELRHGAYEWAVCCCGGA